MYPGRSTAQGKAAACLSVCQQGKANEEDSANLT